MGIEDIAMLVALIMSIIIHEMAHGYMANWLGDPTARLSGRLSPNPLVHIDPLGSVILPALLFISNAGFVFGWAKPVPYNPYNLTDQRYGEAKVAAAGPLMNFAVALIFGTLIRFSEVFSLSSSFVALAAYIVFINILLALFNLLPFPPLDGSKIITALLPFKQAMQYQNFLRTIERYGILILFLVLFLLIQVIWPYLFSTVVTVASIFTGLTPSSFFALMQGM